MVMTLPVLEILVNGVSQEGNFQVKKGCMYTGGYIRTFSCRERWAQEKWNLT